MRSLDAIFLGDPTEEPILFLHGFGTPPARYLPLLNRLAAHYQIIAPDLKGDDLTTSTQRVQELAAHLHLPSYHIVAHSAGAGAALLAASQDQRVSDVASFSGVLPGTRSFARLAAGVAMLARGKIARDANRDTATLARRSLEIAQEISRDVRGHARLTRDLMRFQPKDITVHQPVLFATAQDDPFFPLTKNAEGAIYALCDEPHIQTVPNADHEWPWLEPERAYGMLLQFYDDIARVRRTPQAVKKR